MNPKPHIVMFQGFPISKGSQGEAYRTAFRGVQALNARTTAPAPDLLDRLHAKLAAQVEQLRSEIDITDDQDLPQ